MPHFATQSSFFFSHSVLFQIIFSGKGHFHLKFSNIKKYLSCSSSSQARVTSPKSLIFEVFPMHVTFNLNLGLSFFTFWNVVVQYLGREWPWSNRCPILLGCHLIYRNIKSIIMLHLLWNIYLCFDQITKNIWNTKYPQMWGENVRERNYQCSLGTLIISLPKWVL